jgi:hypothetical protein
MFINLTRSHASTVVNTVWRVKDRVERFMRLVQEGTATEATTTASATLDLSRLHIDELPPLSAEELLPAHVALLRAEYERRAAAAVPGEIVLRVILTRFAEMFTNEGSTMRFTALPGADARDVLCAGTLDTVFHKLMDKSYVDMLDPEFPALVLTLRSYFVADDVEFLKRMREIYACHRCARVQWQENVRNRVLSTLKLYCEIGMPPGNVVSQPISEQWRALCAELDEDSQFLRSQVEFLRAVPVFAEGTADAPPPDKVNTRGESGNLDSVASGVVALKVKNPLARSLPLPTRTLNASQAYDGATVLKGPPMQFGLESESKVESPCACVFSVFCVCALARLERIPCANVL